MKEFYLTFYTCVHSGLLICVTFSIMSSVKPFIVHSAYIDTVILVHWLIIFDTYHAEVLRFCKCCFNIKSVANTKTLFSFLEREMKGLF